MEYTITINLVYVLWAVAVVILFYIYINDDSDDHLTRIRHDVEMRKEWFGMLAEQNKQKAKKASWNNTYRRS
jgi:hypothetical protein